MDEILVGRTQDVSLSAAGRIQAQALAQRLAADPPGAMHVSPRLRAQQTATAIAAGTNALVDTDPAFDEIDFGEWSGRSFDALQSDERWRQWNAERTLTRTPHGESIHDVEQRVIARLRRLRDIYQERRIAIVTHAEIVRTILYHYLGESQDKWSLMEVNPASMTTLVLRADRATVVAVNERVAP
jgi:broad specificity phosphatase PhoE